jgi:hypothetical protein
MDGSFSIQQSAMINFVLLLILVLFDGALTYSGILLASCGTEIEGNPLVKYVMYLGGALVGIIITKLFAIILLLLLHRWSYAFKDVVFWFLILIHCVVVGNWIWILSGEHINTMGISPEKLCQH